MLSGSMSLCHKADIKKGIDREKQRICGDWANFQNKKEEDYRDFMELHFFFDEKKGGANKTLFSVKTNMF